MAMSNCRDGWEWRITLFIGIGGNWFGELIAFLAIRSKVIKSYT
jgi:hypothetical protein